MSGWRQAQTEGEFVSAREVAVRAGVSRSAVSRAFTPGASIAPETRERVLSAALELGYHVNDLARGLLTNRSRLVGLVMTRPEVGYRAHLVAALTRGLLRRGNIPVVIDTGQSEDEMAAARDALFGHRAEATIILSGSPPASFVELARRNGQPLIVIGRSEPECDQVQIDNDTAARLAAETFVSRGLTRLAVAGSGTRTPNLLRRQEIFAAHAIALGATVDLALAPDADYDGGKQAGLDLFGRTGERPQGVFCINDPVALGLIDIARTRFGIAVPGELSVIGFDDIPEASWEPYRLTTFRQDPEAIATAVLAHLDQRRETPGCDPLRAVVEAPLVIRDTVITALE